VADEPLPAREAEAAAKPGQRGRDAPGDGHELRRRARATIERTLNGVDGVEAAAVNYATNRATVKFDPSVLGVADLVAAVRDVGYDVIDGAGIGRPPARPTSPACRTSRKRPGKRST